MSGFKSYPFQVEAQGGAGETWAAGVVGAVLFADLSGFGLLTEARGDEAAAEVAVRFAALVRGSLAPGEQVVKTLGDGVLVVSPDVATARATADRIRHEVAADGSLPPVHAGLREGSVVWRDGDVFGAAVNDAARLAEAAGPWEIAEAPVRPLVLDLSE